MKIIITLIICMFSGIMAANADICFAGGNLIEINNEYYCLSVRSENIDLLNSTVYNEDVFVISLSEKELKDNEFIREVKEEGVIKTNFNFNLSFNLYVVGDQNFTVGPEGEDVIWEETIDPGIGIFKEQFKINDYTNIYKSKNTYTVYENKNCINKNIQGDERYANCKIEFKTTPKFIINIIQDYNYDNYNCSTKTNDSLDKPIDPEIHSQCQPFLCAEQSFVEYLKSDYLLLSIIVLVPISLLTTTIIFGIKYGNLKKKINK